MFADPTQAEINAALKRLGEIGWIRSSIQIKDKGRMAVTPKGAKKLHEFATFLSEIGMMPIGSFSALSALSLKFAVDPKNPNLF